LRPWGWQMRRDQRRRLDDLATKRGMGRAFWEKQKAESERRLSIIDEAPPEWRVLCNLFPQDDVAELAGDGYGVRDAARILEERFGRPI
jgi:hypothetical protein